MSGPFREQPAEERLAVLQEENEALRARVAELEANARADERHIQIRRLEKERDTLRERISTWRTEHEAEAERTQAALKEENAALRADLIEMRGRVSTSGPAETEALRGEVIALRRRLAQHEATELASVTRERDNLAIHVEALKRERDALEKRARGDNESAYLERLTRERDELLAEVRALREGRR